MWLYLYIHIKSQLVKETNRVQRNETCLGQVTKNSVSEEVTIKLKFERYKKVNCVNIRECGRVI